MTFRSRTLARFWERYDKLPETIQRQADKQYALFSQDPFHPSMRLKPVGPFWSVSISRSHRALAVRKDDVFVWFWIGSHDEYERMIRQLSVDWARSDFAAADDSPNERK